MGQFKFCCLMFVLDAFIYFSLYYDYDNKVKCVMLSMHYSLVNKVRKLIFYIHFHVMTYQHVSQDLMNIVNICSHFRNSQSSVF